MAVRKGGNVISAVEQIAIPVARELGLTLWDIEFVKEGASWFLRIYIDKESGISVEDCEAFSHGIDKKLDEVDPIEQSYYLEVSSPGIERELKKDWHFEKMNGKIITIHLIRPVDGRKEIRGVLKAFSKDSVTVLDGEEEISVQRQNAAHIRLFDEDFTGGIEENEC
ncbi:MAG TPA: ribosome maturation factor RimP [Clostridia bacterium]|nr:ribosome maturation factor RimP [Clostridia bacterium]